VRLYEGVLLVATAKSKTNIVPLRARSDDEALAWLVVMNRRELSTAELAEEWRWSPSKVRRRLDRWSSAGRIDVKPGLGGRYVITPVLEAVAATPVGDRVSTIVTVAEAANSSPTGGRVRTVAKKAEPVAASPAGGGASAAVAVPGTAASSAAGDRAPTVVTVPDSPALAEPFAAPGADIAPETVIVPAPGVVAVPDATAHALRARTTGFVNVLAYVVAVALAGIAAYFSIRGMIVLFPGAPTAIVVMGVAMEAAKLVTVAFLAHQWRLLGGLSRAVLVTLVAGLAAINAAGVYSQLVAAHFGDRIAAASAVETEASALAARTEVQTQTVADLDRRVGQIDAAIAEMVKRGRTAGALEAIGAQRKLREALVSQRRHEAETLANLKSEAGAVAAKSRQIELEAAPIMYVAQLMGATTEQAIRLLILLMVLTCDPLALALTAAASRPKAR
jgi:hypothetical protein